MRIAILNGQGGCVGGLEVYLKRVLPALASTGHEVRFFHQWPAPPDREPVTRQNAVCLLELNDADAVEQCAAWNPDVLYIHSPMRESLVLELTARWPAVAFQHGYFGTCVSAAKRFQNPSPRPCDRRFGRACLALYFPRRCGGWNPRAMWHSFVAQRDWLGVMRTFDILACHSDHMKRELCRHGFASERVRVIPFLVPSDGACPEGSMERQLPATGALRLLFLGRFESSKGAHLLLEALPRVSRELGRPISLLLAGDGPQRGRLEKRARRLRANSNLVVEFLGWVPSRLRTGLLCEAHLLVVPSVWPEPFGQTGVEAGHVGVPAVAFDVGGVRAWLEPGVNGFLAPGSPPCSGGLAEAIVQALRSPDVYRELSEGARSRARHFDAAGHVRALEELFTEAVALRSSRGR